MLEKIVSSNTLSKLLESENSPIAIAGKDQKIKWYNKEFRKAVGTRVTKGRNIHSLFDIPDKIKLDNPKRKSFRFQHNSNHTVIINKLFNGKKPEGFSIKLENKNADIKSLPSSNEIFLREIQSILTLLVKETSSIDIADEVLNKCITLSNSSFAIIVFNVKDSKNRYEFQGAEINKYFPRFEEIKPDIETNLNFINKWLNANKRALVGLKSPDNLAANLTDLLKANTIILSPAIFENSHIATIITGKRSGNYSDFEINIISRFSTLLSFAITSIRSRELNAALESKLLQSQKLETIGKLSSGMAHDFSNLLSSIFGSVNLLRKRVPENENITKLIDNIENCSVRARDLTRGLLTFGKPTPKRKELIKPNILLNEISKVVTHTFPKKIDFNSDINEDLHDILGNGTEIYQVLLNLCVNAKEAMDKEGSLSLSAKNILIDRKNNDKHPLLKPGKYVWFSVSDTGSGISEENILRIFEPYFSTKMKESGSGLGLYVTYGIIKAHNGEIEVSSKIDRGTTFDVFIPAYEPTKRSADEENKIILLAEDEEMLNDLLSELLESAGYNVIKVHNGLEVIKVLTEEIKVDMAILDYNMPGLNGLECASKIRELELNIPIILSSGSTSQTEKSDLEKYGITTSVSKPYEFDTLLSTVNKLI